MGIVFVGPEGNMAGRKSVFYTLRDQVDVVQYIRLQKSFKA